MLLERQHVKELAPRALAIPAAARARRRSAMLVASDLAALALAFVTVEATTHGPILAADVDAISWGWEAGLFLLVLPIWIVLAHAYGLYRDVLDASEHGVADDVVRILHLSTMATWASFAGLTVSGLATPDPRRAASFWALQILLVLGGRMAVRRWWSRTGATQRVVIAGAGDVGQLLARRLIVRASRQVELVGFVDPDPRDLHPQVDGIPLLGGFDDLDRLIAEHGVDRVIVAFANEPDATLVELARRVERRGVQVDIVPRLYEIVGAHAQVHTISGIPLVAVSPATLSPMSLAVKRAVDVTLASLALLALSPLLVAAALGVRLTSRGPVLFRQERAGRDGRPFRIFKFRTMVDGADAERHALRARNKHAGDDARMLKVHGDPRVTPLGRILRRTSIDELPQLLNVVRGEMSLVGPRPLVLDEAAHVSDWAERRHALRPGITGLWQVSGRDDLPFGEMVRLDYLYVSNWSVWRDLMIMVRTLPALARGSAADR